MNGHIVYTNLGVRQDTINALIYVHLLNASNQILNFNIKNSLEN